jgi:hypothetical protein
MARRWAVALIHYSITEGARDSLLRWLRSLRKVQKETPGHRVRAWTAVSRGSMESILMAFPPRTGAAVPAMRMPASE